MKELLIKIHLSVSLTCS